MYYNKLKFIINNIQILYLVNNINASSNFGSKLKIDLEDFKASNDIVPIRSINAKLYGLRFYELDNKTLEKYKNKLKEIEDLEEKKIKKKIKIMQKKLKMK